MNEIIGDAAYSGKDHDIKIISKLNPVKSNGNRIGEDRFTFNKDADMFVCPAGHLAIKKVLTGEKKNSNKNQGIRYYFDVEKCKVCPQRDGCYKSGVKTRTYTVTIKSDIHKDQEEFQKSEYFKKRYRVRYMIEAKNGELKNQHGNDVANSSGLFGMQMQGAMSIFMVNIKRILNLLQEKQEDNQ